jgi:hypothetical protein
MDQQRSDRRRRRIKFIQLCRQPSLTSVDPMGLYEEDVHYGLTKALAVRSGFCQKEASRIAAGNQGVDEDPITNPWASVDARRYYHFTTAGRRSEMLAWANLHLRYPTRRRGKYRLIPSLAPSRGCILLIMRCIFQAPRHSHG